MKKIEIRRDGNNRNRIIVEYENKFEVTAVTDNELKEIQAIVQNYMIKKRAQKEYKDS